MGRKRPSPSLASVGKMFGVLAFRNMNTESSALNVQQSPSSSPSMEQMLWSTVCSSVCSSNRSAASRRIWFILQIVTAGNGMFLISEEHLDEHQTLNTTHYRLGFQPISNSNNIPTRFSFRDKTRTRKFFRYATPKSQQPGGLFNSPHKHHASVGALNDRGHLGDVAFEHIDVQRSNAHVRSMLPEHLVPVATAPDPRGNSDPIDGASVQGFIARDAANATSHLHPLYALQDGLREIEDHPQAGELQHVGRVVAARAVLERIEQMLAAQVERVDRVLVRDGRHEILVRQRASTERGAQATVVGDADRGSTNASATKLPKLHSPVRQAGFERNTFELPTGPYDLPVLVEEHLEVSEVLGKRSRLYDQHLSPRRLLYDVRIHIGRFVWPTGNVARVEQRKPNALRHTERVRRMVYDTNDTNFTSTTLQHDASLILPLQRRLLAIVNVRHHHRAVDCLQKRHQTFHTVVELVIAERHGVGWQQIQEVRCHIPPQKCVPDRALEAVTRVQVHGIPIGVLLLERFDAGYDTSVPADAAFPFVGFAARRHRVRLLETGVKIVQVDDRQRI
uniref:Uncharacterized protein n=1 Tax=Anopheles farauti TaxID=69004 RepID=A0A182QKU2_9DIPT